MKQVWISKAGRPEVLVSRDEPDPALRSGEVRIRVEASGVNFIDILGRMGIYEGAPKIPYVPGHEVAGVIDAVGQGVPDLKEGDHVLATTAFKGYSDVVCVPHKQVFKRLDWMSAEHGAALPLAYLTAYQALVIMGSLRQGDKVLILNSANDIGVAALDICKILGAETFGTAAAAKHAFLTQRGLQHPIDYHNMDYQRVVTDLTGGRGVQIILDPMGGIHWRKNYPLLMPTGRLIHLGIHSAARSKRRSFYDLFRMWVNVPLYTPLQLMRDSKAIIGINQAHLWEHADLARPWMRQIITWYDEALFRPHIDETFKFSQAAEAHHHIQDRKNCGKVLLRQS